MPVVRHCIVAHEEYWCEIDEHQRPNGPPFLLGHIRFAKFSKSILRGLLNEWAAFRAVFTAPIFAVGEDPSPKFTKFVRLLGFQPLTEVICNNGERRCLFISQ